MVGFRSLLAIWPDKGWGNPDRNVVTQTICCWWACEFAWWSFWSVLLRLWESQPGGIEHDVTRGHNAAYRRNGIWNCLFRVRHLLSDTCLSKSEQQLPSSSSTLSSSDSSGAWISSHFRIQVGSADECVAPGRRQPRDTRWTSDGPLSSPQTNLKRGLLPLFFMQLLLSHLFLSFMVRTSPLITCGWFQRKIKDPWLKPQLLTS